MRRAVAVASEPIHQYLDGKTLQEFHCHTASSAA
jgi:hypothetical protein